MMVFVIKLAQWELMVNLSHENVSSVAPLALLAVHLVRTFAPAAQERRVSTAANV